MLLTDNSANSSDFMPLIENGLSSLTALPFSFLFLHFCIALLLVFLKTLDLRFQTHDLTGTLLKLLLRAL